MKFKKFLPIVGIVILIYLIYRIGLIKIINSIASIKYYYLILAVLVLIIYLFFFALKWSLILKKQGINVNIFYLFKLYMVGYFYGTITPARTGSLIRAYYLKDKIDKPFGECASSIILERFLDLSTIFILAIIGCLLLLNYFTIKVLLYVVIAFIIFLGLFFFLINKRRSRIIFKRVYKFLIPKKFKSVVKDSYDSFYSNLPSLNKLIIPFLITFITWVIVYFVSYIIAKSLSIHVPIYYFIPLYAFSTIIAIIPITISGLGTRELTLVGLFSIFNILPEKIIAMSLLSLVLGFFPAVLGFIFSLKIKGKNEILTNSASGTG